MIDWARVADLRAEIGPESFDEVVALFLEEAEAVVTRVATGNAGQVAHDLHLLKGLALNLGFRDLARSCQDQERKANPSDKGLSDVVASYRASVAQFAHGLAANAA